ncbi:MAG: sugar ABC transporter ATP-binding protein [Verrucomicrobia bacterium]|nr:sugar ABC transporter ATP-binding protein [Verrucomicrobiota bacterium]
MSAPVAPFPSSAPLLTMRGIRKAFAGVTVLHDVDFSVHAGEVHALCGENGAGKSTLMNILAGVVRPDQGEIVLAGTTARGFANAHAARQAGVSMVFQERSLFEPLTVAENIFAGRQPVDRWGCINRRALATDAAAVLARVAPEIAPVEIVAGLSPARQQMVEIAKALSLEAKIVIFDEPTASLTATEISRLFAVIRQLRAAGTGIIYISHRLEEIFALADRVTVLKDGGWQATLPVSQTDADDLIRRMVGRDLKEAAQGRADSRGPVLLDVRGLRDAGQPALRDITFHVRAGEIVGFAGLSGAGRTETALALFGLRPREAGEIELGGRRIEPRSPAEAIADGLGYLSEDRKEAGLFSDLSVRRNLSAARLGAFGGWFFRDGAEAAEARDRVGQLRIACRDIEQDVAHLSGGNQQKVVLGRWLKANPRVLIVDEPTRGVDVGAKAEVHEILRAYARRGHAVIVISSDLPEVLRLADRIYVMRRGRIAGELAAADASEEAVMRLAAADPDAAA